MHKNICGLVPKFFTKRNRNKGKAPGALTFIGVKKMDKPRIRLFDYNNEALQERELEHIDESLPYARNEQTVTWINIDGLHDTQLMETIEERFNIHPLAMEDILNTDQRARFEDYGNHLYITFKMLTTEGTQLKIMTEQISFVIGKGFVLTFQEQTGDVFEDVRNRIRLGLGRLRRVGNDYLAYALMDTIVDNYIYLLENFGEKIEDLELKVLDNPSERELEEVNTYKRELHLINKLVKPSKEAVKDMLRTASPLVNKKTFPFLKDLYDLNNHATELIDTFRTLLSDYLNLYHMSLSSRMNDVMKTLTIFSAIFIPLTFIAGVYGMNFEHLPGQGLQDGFYYSLMGMGLVGAGMVVFLKLKKWF